MHGTRTTAKILVGAAVAALAGCVSVDAPSAPPSPAPATDSPRPAQAVAPQIVEGPAREALEAALPPPPPSTAPRSAPPAEPHRRVLPPRPEAARPAAVPPRRERPRPAARPTLPEPPVLTGLPRTPPVSRADVCALGERYGGWRPGSDQSRICRGVYGR
ncbi:hypothetical protein [Streptomyces sp. NPDC088557]|uniref:hypothetical protein n=1 Tax=Streptomyces sp. NPDC088557 TaxID=3365867 RepID=UPI00382EBFCA